MKSKEAIAYFVAIAAMGVVMMGLSESRAQDEETKETKVKDVKVVVPDQDMVFQAAGVNPFEIRDVVKEGLDAVGIHVHDSVQGKIRKAAEKLRDAEGDQAQAQAQQELAELLGKYFDEDLARREEELAKLEQRLEKLRTQLARRAEKRQEIIELQIKVAVNEADGLGFLSQPVHGHHGADFDFKFGDSTLHLSNGDASIALPMPGPHPEPTQPTEPSEESQGEQ